MAKEPRPKREPFKPLAKIEPGEPPSYSTGRAKVDEYVEFRPVFDQIRALAGEPAKIMEHADCTDFVRRVRQEFPEFEFMTRTYEKDGVKVQGIWARLRVAVPEPPKSLGEPAL